MRTRAWWSTLCLAAAAAACGDQPTEVVPERELEGPGTVALATASSGDGLSISTDKDDYQPGDTVWFTGAGWPVEDTLDIVLEDEPATHPPHSWSVPVDEHGGVRDSSYVVDVGDLGVTFTLTATSRGTGRTLQVTFTDGQPQDVTVTATVGSVAPSETATYNIAVNMVGNDNACTVTLQVTTALPAGASASFNDNPIALPNGGGNVDFSRTLSITTTAATPPGTYNFTVRATRGAGCQGSGAGPTGAGTLIVFGPATHLAFGQQPSNALSTVAISPTVTVRVLDANNNVVGNSAASVDMAIGSNPGGGTLSGTVPQNAVNGVATFPGLSVDKVGTGYNLAASSSGLTGVTSSDFNITLGPAAKLAFSVQPSGAAPGTAFTTQPVVQVQDAGGNLRTSGGGSNATILLSITPGTGTGGAALTCTTNPRAAAGGIDAFAGCRINLAGFDYQLRASATGLTAADSDPFSVIADNQPPTVNAGSYTLAEGTELTLAPTVNDSDGDALTYKWTVTTTGIDAGGACTFLDDTEKNAKITCTDDSQGAPGGKFTLTLAVNDGSGPVSDDADLAVSNVVPVANAGADYEGDEGSAIPLSGSANDPGDNDDSHLTYQWSVVTTGIDAGGECTIANATSIDAATVTCTDDSNAGSFTVKLVATDDDGGVSTASEADLTVKNVKPTASASSPSPGEEGSPIQLSGSADDPGNNDDPGLTYKWTVNTAGVDPNGECTFGDDTDQNTTITCTDDGSFTVTLVAKDDDDGTSTGSTVSLEVANAGPVADAGPNYIGNEGSPVQLQGSVTDAGTNDTHTWSWKYLPGSNVDANASCSFAPNKYAEDPTITCTDDGTVELTLTVKDDDGSEDSDDAVLSLANLAPVAEAGDPVTGSEGDWIALNGSANDPGDNDDPFLEYHWTVSTSGIDAGGGCSFDDASKKNAKVRCTDDSNLGTFTLTLVANDDDNGISAGSQTTLTVTNAAPDANPGNAYAGFEGAAVQLGGSGDDPGDNDDDHLTYEWTVTPSGIDAGGTCTFDDDTDKDATVLCTDDSGIGTFSLSLVVKDDDGGTSAAATVSLAVANKAPEIQSFTLGNGDPIPVTVVIGTTLSLQTAYQDAGSNDTHPAEIDCGTGANSVGSNVASPFTTSCTFATIGSKTVAVKVSDDDGGVDIESRTILVAYHFDGFFTPVDRPNTMNISKAGQTIPLKWRLTDASGAGVPNVVGVTIKAVGLSSCAYTTTDQIEEYAAGSSGLQDMGNGYYQFNWKTPAAYANSCKSIALVFGAGAESYIEGPHALFTFKK